MKIKARITFEGDAYFIEVVPGVPIVSTKEEVKNFLLSYSNPNHYPHQSTLIDSVAAGEVLAYVTDNNELIILSSYLLESLFSAFPRYITVVEYAERYGKKRNIIARFCREGRIPGAFQKGHCWLIPENAPYPKHGHLKNS